MSNTTSAKATTQSLRWRLGPLWSLVSLLLIVVAATMVTTMFGKSLQVQAQYALVNLVIVVALQLFIGTSGVLSFGHVAFVAMGAWTVGLLTIDPTLKKNLLPDLFPFLMDAQAQWVLAVLIGGLVGGLLALIVAPVLMRLNGLQAGIATFALLGVVNVVLTYWSSIGPRSGQSMVGIPEVLDLKLTMLFALGSIIVAWLFQRTRPSRLLRAAREDGIAAAASGINIVTQRVIVFAVSGVIAGVAGGLFALTNRVVQASQLFVEMTFITLAMLVLGGTLSLSGAVIGTLVFSAIDVMLSNLQSGIDIFGLSLSIPQGTRPIILGLILVLMLMFKASGLTGGREFVWPFRTVRPLPGNPPTNE
jgi:branched-chain amino acid transport system permease protein